MRLGPSPTGQTWSVKPVAESHGSLCSGVLRRFRNVVSSLVMVRQGLPRSGCRGADRLDLVGRVRAVLECHGRLCRGLFRWAVEDGRGQEWPAAFRRGEPVRLRRVSACRGRAGYGGLRLARFGQTWSVESWRSTRAWSRHGQPGQEVLRRSTRANDWPVAFWPYEAGTGGRGGAGRV